MGSHADDIVGDYFESEDWALVEPDAESETDAPVVPSHESAS